MEVNIALLAEHKLDTTQPRVTSKLYNEAQEIFGASCFTIHAASTAIKSSTVYKPGGVLSLLNGGVRGRVLLSKSDPHGRWTSTTFTRTFSASQKVESLVSLSNMCINFSTLNPIFIYNDSNDNGNHRYAKRCLPPIYMVFHCYAHLYANLLFGSHKFPFLSTLLPSPFPCLTLIILSCMEITCYTH